MEREIFIFHKLIYLTLRVIIYQTLQLDNKLTQRTFEQVFFIYYSPIHASFIICRTQRCIIKQL